MNENQFPKLNMIALSRYIMDLLMCQDGNESHVHEPRVRVIWHLLFFSVNSFFIINYLVTVAGSEYLATNSIATTCYRTFVILIWIYFIILIAVLSVRYYQYLLLTAKDLRFYNILFFYFAVIVSFGYLYRGLYYLNPSLFLVADSFVQPTQFLIQNGLWDRYLITFDFFLYSASTIVSLEYPRIHTASAMISFCNVIQVFFGIGIVTLLVATFIQKVDVRKTE